MKLATFCKEEGLELPWEEVLKDMNKMVAEAFVLANIHAIRSCDVGFELPSLNISFFQQCLSAVSGGDLDHPRTTITQDFRESVALYDSWRDSAVPRADRTYIHRGWAQVTAKQMADCTQNHIRLNFYNRFKKYLKLRYGLTGNSRYNTLKHILAQHYARRDRIVCRYRPLLLRTDEGFVDRRAHLLLPVTKIFLEYIERYNIEHAADADFEEARGFTLLPTKKGFKCSHFTMSGRGLRAMMMRAGYVGIPSEGPDWNAAESFYWDRFFKLKKVESYHPDGSRSRAFAGEITTDGKAVSIVVSKPTHASRPLHGSPHTAAQFTSVWGVDPGRRDFFVASCSDGTTIRCSSKEFYRDASYTQSNTTIRHWYDSADSTVTDAVHGMPTKKSCSLEKWQTYVGFMIPRFDQLLGFAMQKKFRDLKFRRYCLARKKLRQICELFVAGRDAARTIIGFGDWSCTDYGGFLKKCPGGPSKRLERELKKYCRVETENEYRTSRVHFGCATNPPQDLSPQYQRRECRDGVVRRLKVHSVLHCKACGVTVNRDVNASQNILLLFQRSLRGLPRLRHFCRTRRRETN